MINFEQQFKELINQYPDDFRLKNKDTIYSDFCLGTKANAFDSQIGDRLFKTAFELNNSKQAIKILQKIVGVVDDGLIGPKTMAAVTTMPIDTLLLAYDKERQNYPTYIIPSPYTYLTIEDLYGIYLNHKDATSVKKENSKKFLEKVNKLLEQMQEDGITLKINPNTKTIVSGRTDGGFRLLGSTTGASLSSHKEGRACDFYDPNEAMDKWCMSNQEKLKSLGLYMEHPDATRGWCHLTDRAPGSGKTVFYP